MKLRIVSLIILICGAALLTGSIIREHKSKKAAPKPPRSFVLQYLSSRSMDGSPMTPYEYAVRWVSATGEWKETRYSFDGRVSSLGGASDGFYMVNGNSLQLYGQNDLDYAKNAFHSEEEFKASPQLTRVEPFLGLTAYVLKEDQPNMEIETSSSPETGVTALKRVMRTKPGSGTDYIEVKEAINLEFRELSEDEAHLPSLPIRFDLAEQKAKDLKAAGQFERAESLQRVIKELKAVQK